METGIGVIERLLAVVNTPKKLLMLAALTFLGGSSALGWYLIRNDAVIDEITAPRIERVGTAISGGVMCYQQRLKVRTGMKPSRLIGIQFPVSDKLVKMGVEQNLAGFTVDREPTAIEFQQLCDELASEISSPERQKFLWEAYPKHREKLLEFYQKMNTEEKPPVLKLKGQARPTKQETAASLSTGKGNS